MPAFLVKGSPGTLVARLFSGGGNIATLSAVDEPVSAVLCRNARGSGSLTAYQDSELVLRYVLDAPGQRQAFVDDRSEALYPSPAVAGWSWNHNYVRLSEGADTQVEIIGGFLACLAQRSPKDSAFLELWVNLGKRIPVAAIRRDTDSMLGLIAELFTEGEPDAAAIQWPSGYRAVSAG